MKNSPNVVSLEFAIVVIYSYKLQERNDNLFDPLLFGNMIKDAKPLRRSEAIEELNLCEEMEKMHFPPIVGVHRVTVHRFYCSGIQLA